MAKYFFNATEQDPETCHTLDGWINQMKCEGIDQIKLIEAKPFYGSGYFYCQELGQVGEVVDSGCGKFCELYKPRNGKNGRCIHSHHLYTHGERTFTLTCEGQILETNKD